MKHIYSTILIAGAFLFVSGVAYAYTGADGVQYDRNTKPPVDKSQPRPLVETRKEVREDIKDIRNDAKEDIKNEREGLKSDIDAKRLDVAKQIAKKRYDLMLARYKATIQRIENIQTKIVTRIEKIKAAGGKTEVADKLVVEAKTHIAEAKTSYAKLEVAIQAAIEATATTTASTTPKNVKDMTKNLKTLTQEVEKHIQAAHKSLEKALGSLKGLSRVPGTASSTTNVNTTN